MRLFGGDVAPSHYSTLQNNAAAWWWQDAGMRKLAVAIGVGFAGTINGGNLILACAMQPYVHILILSGYDGSLMNGLLSNPRFVTAIDHPDGNKLGIISAAYSLGALIGIVPAPWVADKYGRRAAIALGATVIIAGSMIQTFTTGGNAMLGGRLVVGFGASFQAIGGGPLVAEIAHPRNRPQATALINTCWYIGSIIAAWTTFGALNIASSWSWRLCCLIQAVPCAIQLVGLWFCEESPRWLISKGQEEKGLRVLAKYHGNGDENDELVSFEFQEIKEAIAAERAATANVNVMTLTKTKGNRHRLLILIVSNPQTIQLSDTADLLSVWPSSLNG
jgi:MFS family permease